MICAGLSDILYLGTFGENSCIVCALLLLLYALAVTLHSTRIIYVHYIDRHIRFVLSSRSQYTLRRESQQRSNAVGFVKVCSVYTSNLTSHRVAVWAKRNQVFFIIVVVNVVVVVVVVIALRQRFQVHRGGRFRKIARFKNSFMSRTSYELSRIVIFASSLVK